MRLPLVIYDPSKPLYNGSFERGADDSWTTHTLRATHNIWGQEELGADPLAHSGRYVAHLGGADAEVSVIEQLVTVPPLKPVLSLWYQSRSQDECGYDFGGVVVNDRVEQRVDLCLRQTQLTWQPLRVNLSAYAGQTVVLQVRGETDGSAVSSFYVDDLAWEAP
ncbi:MAG TPA: hypothetical protein PKE45_07530 [Caldilineaceae bacterium]|nr:hypothetical protein [Caldilineaceae bacterium]